MDHFTNFQKQMKRRVYHNFAAYGSQFEVSLDIVKINQGDTKLEAKFVLQIVEELNQFLKETGYTNLKRNMWIALVFANLAMIGVLATIAMLSLPVLVFSIAGGILFFFPLVNYYVVKRYCRVSKETLDKLIDFAGQLARKYHSEHILISIHDDDDIGCLFLSIWSDTVSQENTSTTRGHYGSCVTSEDLELPPKNSLSGSAEENARHLGDNAV
jgi:hypothetical protein